MEQTEDLLRLTKENNEMLRRLTGHLDKITSEESINKEQMRAFISDVIGNLFAYWMLNPSGQEPKVTKQDIIDIINRMK